MLILLLCVCIYAGFGRLVGFVILSALAHELCHLTYLLVRRCEMRALRINFLGAEMETSPLSYVDEMLCALSGPLANFILYLVFSHRNGPFAILNLGSFLFNMLPIYPLDGGRILRAGLQCLCADANVHRIVRITGIVASLLLMLGIVSLCVLLQQGIWLMLVCAAVIIKLQISAEREGY